ncbi:MAG TPA: SusC/RagA family TonB-linked outer membrane protein [Bacteroides sp.]|nr:SusC/RagA family TonB-linked outer membrane protein [Bacteroides sp.]
MLMKSYFDFKKWARRVLLVAFLFNLTFLVVLAQVTVTGTVTMESGETVPGTTIQEKGTTNGTITNVDGNYSITVAGGESVLVYSFVGYETQEIVVGNQTVINTALAVSLTAIEEIVVTGYGSQSRATITTSIETVAGEDLQNVPAGGHAVNALVGKVPGVIVLQKDGRSGSAPAIQIRGGTTPGFGGDSPLYIVNGFIQDDLGGLDMNDIEEFTILKDAAAAAIYGAQAANGVIIVKTRTGRVGQMSVQFKYAHEWQSIERYRQPVMTPEEEMYYARIGYLNYERSTGYQFISGRSQWWSAVQPYDPSQAGYVLDNASQLHWYDDVIAFNGSLPAGWHKTVDPVTGRQMAFPVNDWQDATLTDGSADNYFLNFNGGSEKATYNVSLGFYDVQGVGVFNDYKRYYMSANTDFKMSDKVKSGFTFGYTLEDENRGEGNQWYQRSGRQSITTRLFKEDGSPAPNFKNSGKYNPAYYESHLIRERVNSDLRIGTFMEWEIIPGLTFKPMISARHLGSNYASMIYENEISGAKRDQSAWSTSALQTQIDALLIYDKQFGDHSLNLLAGSSFRDTRDYEVAGSTFGSASDLVPVLQPTTPQENSTVSSEYVATAIQSWFGQVSYDYKKRYLLNATLRADGNYKFTDENKWGIFPGISAGWNIHQEDFWSSMGASWFTKAKIKAAYGEAGQSKNLSIYDTQGRYATTSYAGTTGVLQSNLQNPELKWETTREWGFGMDLGFLNNRLGLIFDYYDKASIDRLFLEPLPSFTGYTGIRTNVGTFGSSGIELSVNANIVRSGDWNWNVSAFADLLLSQETIKLPDNGTEANRIGGTFVTNPDNPTGDPILVGGLAEGERSGAIYGYVNEGIIQNWDEADAYNATHYDELMAGSANHRQFKKPGDHMWADLNGDGRLNSYDREFKGYQTHNKRFGFTNTLNWTPGFGKFLFSFTLEAMTGHMVEDWMGMRMMAQAQGGDRPGLYNRSSWLEEGDNGFARYTWANNHTGWNYGRTTEPFLQKADYLALRHIELKYTVPQAWANKIRLQELSTFVTGYNVGFLTNYKGMDPAEVDGSDNISRVPPAPLTISFGIDLKF